MWRRYLLRLTLCIVDHIDEAGFSDFADIRQRSHPCRWPLGDIVAWDCTIVRFCWPRCRLPSLHASSVDGLGEEVRAGCTAHHWRGCCEKRCVPLRAHLDRQTLPALACVKMEVAEDDLKYGHGRRNTELNITSGQRHAAQGSMVLCLPMHAWSSRASAKLSANISTHTELDQSHAGSIGSFTFEMSLCSRHLRHLSSNGTHRQVGPDRRLTQHEHAFATRCLLCTWPPWTRTEERSRQH